MKLLVATGNPGKLVEVREILGGLELDLVSLADLGLEAPEEPFATFQENAAAKATSAADLSLTGFAGAQDSRSSKSRRP